MGVCSLNSTPQGPTFKDAAGVIDSGAGSGARVGAAYVAAIKQRARRRRGSQSGGSMLKRRSYARASASTQGRKGEIRVR